MGLEPVRLVSPRSHLGFGPFRLIHTFRAGTSCITSVHPYLTVVHEEPSSNTGQDRDRRSTTVLLPSRKPTTVRVQSDY